MTTTQIHVRGHALLAIAIGMLMSLASAAPAVVRPTGPVPPEEGSATLAVPDDLAAVLFAGEPLLLSPPTSTSMRRGGSGSAR